MIRVKSHRRGRSVIKAHSRGTKLQRARDLKWKLSTITARGGFLNRPQKKAFYKVSTLLADIDPPFKRRRRPAAAVKRELEMLLTRDLGKIG
jgi:hypothetical protein